MEGRGVFHLYVCRYLLSYIKVEGGGGGHPVRFFSISSLGSWQILWGQLSLIYRTTCTCIKNESRRGPFMCSVPARFFSCGETGKLEPRGTSGNPYAPSITFDFKTQFSFRNGSSLPASHCLAAINPCFGISICGSSQSSSLPKPTTDTDRAKEYNFLIP